MKKEKKIYVKQIFYELLLKWKQIVVCMIVFAVLANIFFCIKYYMAIQKTVAEQQENTQEIDISSYKDALSETDAKLVEDYFQMYKKHRETYDKILEYYDESIKINLDPGCIPAVNIEYKIDNCEESEDFVDTLMFQVENNTVAKKIINELGLDTQESYIWELVKFEDMRDATSTTNSNVVLQEEEGSSFVILVQILAPNTKTAEGMAKILNEEVLESSSDLKDKYGNFSIEAMKQISTSIVDKDLMTQQHDYSSRLNNLKTYFENLRSSMTEGQESYFDALIENYEAEDEVVPDSDVVEEVTVVEKPEMQYINIKYIILGLAIGFVLSAAYACLPYVFGNKLAVLEEVSDYYGLSLLGTMEDERKKKESKLTQKINLVFDKNRYNNTKEEKSQLICTQVLMALRKAKAEKVYLASTLDTDEINRVEREIVEKLGKSGVKATIGNMLLYRQDALEGLMAEEYIIIVEKLGSSNLEDIYKEIEVCNNYNVMPIGAIIIES